jgi:predicted lipase
MDAEWAQVSYDSPLGNPPSGMKVGEGFYGVYNGLLASLTSQLQATPKQGYTHLLLTGHSLGSTLATLAVPLAVSLGFTGFQYNQASPRVGNPTFASYVSELSIPTFRLVNIYDAVPKSPPSIPGREYQAVGLEASYGADYPTEGERHSPCCSYSYALFNGQHPYNPDIKRCM